MGIDADRYRVKPGEKLKLSKHDPGDKSLWDGGKTAGKTEAEALNERIEGLQELLYAEGKRRLLVVLQAMDCGGKDSTIRYVFDGVNPQGVKVASFKKPTEDELAHDYLWRVHQHVPRNGEIVIFNRSHYEDVLVVRVHGLVEKSRWKRRYQHIRNFEQMLAEEGTVIRKFFLNISRDEQRQRLQERIDIPHKRWKFSSRDLDERKLWNDYQEAYQDALAETSTEWAPWYVVPANSKWYRNLVISSVLVETLEGLEMRYPPVEEGIAGLTVE